MPKHVVVVLSEPFEGQDDAFNDWYEYTHIDEVLSSAGIDSGQRFELTAEEGMKSPHKYLAFYEVEAESGENVLATLKETRGERQQCDAFNRKTAGMWVFTETGPKHERENS